LAVAADGTVVVVFDFAAVFGAFAAEAVPVFFLAVLVAFFAAAAVVAFGLGTATVGAVMLFGAFGVGEVVQRQLLPLSAHAWPSVATSYTLVWLSNAPAGSYRVTCPPELDKLRPVSAEKNALKLCGDIVVPAGKVN